MLVFVLVIPIMSWAQDLGGDPPVIFDPATWFVTLGAFVAAVMMVTEFIKKAFKIEGNWAMILSWIIAIALAAVGWILQYGIFAGLTWYWGLIYALSAGLIANKGYELGVVTGFLNVLKAIINSMQKPK